MLVHDGFDLGEKLVDVEGPLGQIDQMRAVIGEFARQRRGGGEKAGMPAHDHRQINARQRPIVEIGAHEGLGDETRGGGKARRVVIGHQVVVDGLGNMDAAQRIVGGLGLFAR